MDFNIEEYKKKQEAKKRKEIRLKRKKTRNQLIAFALISVFLGYILSLTEMGCDFLENYFIESEVKPILAQAKALDNYKPEYGYPYEPEKSDHFKRLIKQHFTNDSWLIGLQERVARTNYFWSRDYKAYRSFHKLRVYFGQFLPETKVIEIFSMEISTSKDSGQFKDCGELMEEFFLQYSEKKHIAEPWYSDVVKVEQNWRLLSTSKKQINEFVR